MAGRDEKDASGHARVGSFEAESGVPSANVKIETNPTVAKEPAIAPDPELEITH